MSFTDGKPWIATEKDCKLNWGGHQCFCCYLCGHRFRPGDTVRWQFTNNIKGAGGNPLVCASCDGDKEKIIERMKDINKIRERFRDY